MWFVWTCRFFDTSIIISQNVNKKEKLRYLICIMPNCNAFTRTALNKHLFSLHLLSIQIVFKSIAEDWRARITQTKSSPTTTIFVVKCNTRDTLYTNDIYSVDGNKSSKEYINLSNEFEFQIRHIGVSKK